MSAQSGLLSDVSCKTPLGVLCLWSVFTSCACGPSERPVPVVCLHSELHVLCLWCACTASYTSCACGVPAQRAIRPVPVVCLHSELYVLCLWCACTASSDSECLDRFQGRHASLHTHTLYWRRDVTSGTTLLSPPL